MYESQHVHAHSHLKVAIFNPHEKPVEKLPIIYGFNNGKAGSFFHAGLLAEDGTALGEHYCSSEAYMPSDLGVLEGTRPDRHNHFQMHYPNGYRMEFVSAKDVLTHVGLTVAIQRNTELAPLDS